ncbi:hypothetical protein J5N97_027831 [Dioscorea zingiberensis]|uniref:Uncharacterized protein n=1 Tax=Dioscorea zingiberensis TaxID=325984 RepID=A0A9D5BY02_9LILI|nr:hypothetical protein J5N97_027831 [Dioscorea zingiberensis]
MPRRTLEIVNVDRECVTTLVKTPTPSFPLLFPLSISSPPFPHVRRRFPRRDPAADEMISVAMGDDESELGAHRRVISHPSPPLPPIPGSKSRLHNFFFPTGSWGSTKAFRCTKSPSVSTPPVAAITPEEASSPSARPWNLRTRRAACSAPMEGDGTEAKNSGSRSRSPSRMEKVGTSSARTVRLRSEGGGDKAQKGGESRSRRLIVPLSKEEIEEDFYAFKGSKPPRRPKKRPRIVQRQLESLCPAFWLSEVTPDMKVDLDLLHGLHLHRKHFPGTKRVVLTIGLELQPADLLRRKGQILLVFGFVLPLLPTLPLRPNSQNVIPGLTLIDRGTILPSEKSSSAEQGSCMETSKLVLKSKSISCDSTMPFASPDIGICVE